MVSNDVSLLSSTRVRDAVFHVQQQSRPFPGEANALTSSLFDEDPIQLSVKEKPLANCPALPPLLPGTRCYGGRGYWAWHPHIPMFMPPTWPHGNAE